MTTNHHTAWIDGTTEFKTADMNPPLSDLDEAITGVQNGYVVLDYDYHFQYLDALPPASQVLGKYVISRPQTLPNGAAGCRGDADVAATASTVFNIQRNGSTIGTATFGIGATTCTFSVVGDKELVAGDVLEVVAPGSQDATLQEISIVLVTTKEASPSSSSSSESSTSV